MKKFKKIASLLLALVMVCAMSVTAFADDSTYSIIISEAADGETYSAYKVFDIDSYSGDNVSYTIEENNNFYSVVARATSVFTLTQVGDSTTYVVTVAEGVTAAQILTVLSNATLPNSADGSAVASYDFATISLSEAGYYYVTTTLGSIVALDSTTPTAAIVDKNGEPTVDKEVVENSNSSTGKTNDAGVGDTVTFKSTITDIKGAEKLVLHDTMTNLTFVSVSSVTLNGNALTSDDYTVVTEDLEDNCTFEVVFNDEFLATLKEEGTIVVTYTATVSASAATQTATNETNVSYGNAGTSESTGSKTYTYTYGLKIFKYTGTETKLKGAEFQLSKTVDETSYYAVFSDGILSNWTNEESDATTLVSDENGEISIGGLDAGTYTLTETKAPSGYNLLTSPLTVVITGTTDGDTDELTGEYTVTVDGTDISGSTVKVENNAGSEMPSTGGIGTTIFYVVGTVMVLGAVVVLITRKRMSAQ